MGLPMSWCRISSINSTTAMHMFFFTTNEAINSNINTLSPIMFAPIKSSKTPTNRFLFQSSSFFSTNKPYQWPTHEAWCWCIPISGRRLRKPKLAISLPSLDSKIPPPVPRWTFCWCPRGEVFFFWGGGTKKPRWSHGLNMKIHDFH